MKVLRLVAARSEFLAFGGTTIVAALLIAAIALTSFHPIWGVFLAGVLVAAVLAMMSRTLNARRMIARRTAQLNPTGARLATEIQGRTRADEAFARARANAELIDESFPAMLTYVDAEERVRYHNRAYTRWIGLEGEVIDGRSVNELMGDPAYSLVDKHLKEAMGGKDVRYERTQTMPNGSICRLYVQYLPRYAANGKVLGVFTILTDITGAEDVASGRRKEEQEAAEGARNRLVSALAHDEFTLFSQPIAPMGRDGAEAMREVLVRMNVEEENHLPPGAFLPVAEELGLLHEIDRWVVTHVIDFVAREKPVLPSTYFVNLAGTTIDDPAFVKFVRATLASRGVDGRALCFELTEADVLAHATAYRAFVAALEGSGCRFAISGFGCNPMTLRFLNQLHVNFVKLDGGVIFNVLRKPAELARVKAINQAAHDTGMLTIAECVETESARAALERCGTDFAQGFSIGEPGPMTRLAPTPAVTSSRN